ncbi:hypothetical protein SAMN05216428_10186 [Nitrosospira sp. Nsp11]|uniref:hypothetical protein n=1 Tax=Nitrosospira sp. Nsp11 TaxID=1855338 RepID=UPI00091CF9AA|nr:hypothetical protein [Nitrosospira sp. Nsp11]SHL10497.1 hypothetical protein SAMN05216428_10186 [Nitrosospira sp. Nsp11]
MSKYVHSTVLDDGLNAIRSGAIRMLLLKAYTLGDSYATVTGNSICEVTMASGDYALTGADGAARVLSVSAKSGAAFANSGATPDLHIAFTDSVSKVLLVTDETSDQVITLGNTVNFPSLTYTSGQPA